MDTSLKTLDKYPYSRHTQYMKYLLIIVISFMFIGCSKDRFTNTTARTWDSAPVRLDSIPNDVVPDLLGNIGMLARVFGVNSTPSQVYVKKHNDMEWELLAPELSQGHETYIYDAVTHEVRFQGCNTTWAYAIYY